MNKNISIIGGDLRIVYLAELWRNEGFNVYTYGLEEANGIKENLSINECTTIEECIGSSDIIVSAIPFSKDDVYVNAKFSKNEILLDEITKFLENKTFIAGSISKRFYKLIESKNNVKIFDLMNSEEMAILNSISTAEGAIKIAIEETDITIHGSNILILGFGRIGKVLAKILDAMGANVFCEARKQEDLAWIETYGYNKINLKELDKNLGKYDIVFNTIPHVILDRSKLELLNKEVLIIDLASKPGGVDRDAANDLKIKTIWALALPGKVAPRSAAQIIKHTIEHELL